MSNKATQVSHRNVIGPIGDTDNFLQLHYESNTGDNPYKVAAPEEKDKDGKVTKKATKGDSLSQVNILDIGSITIPAREKTRDIKTAQRHVSITIFDGPYGESMEFMFTVMKFSFEMPFISAHFNNNSLLKFHYENRYSIKLTPEGNVDDDFNRDYKTGLPLITSNNSKKRYDRITGTSCQIIRIGEIPISHTSDSTTPYVDVTIFVPNATYIEGKQYPPSSA